MSSILWEPSVELVARSPMTAFRSQVERHHHLSLPDYGALYRWSIENLKPFWNEVWDFCGVKAERRGAVTVVDPDKMPGARWFPEARLNFAENCLGRRDEGEALVFRGEDRVVRRVSWAALYAEVSRVAQALRAAGIRPSDRVASYLPNLPETVIAALGAAAVGAVWSSCSPDFGVDGVVERFGQIAPRVLFAADGYLYNGRIYNTLEKIAELRSRLPSVEQLVVASYVEPESSSRAGTAVSWEEFLRPFAPGEIGFEQLPFNHPLYILYSSGTTGVPKCIVHGAGSVLLQHLKEHRLHVGVVPGDRIFYFTTCGWMMWNWLVSGLASGATLLLYDGSPFSPSPSALLDYAEAERLTMFGVSAKYLDSVAKEGLSPIRTHQLGHLRTICSTGSPLADEGFDYVYENVKKDVCLASITGGTDLISCFALGNPTLPVRRGEIQCRGLGMAVEVWSDEGRAVRGEKGELVCTAPFPTQPLCFWNDSGDAKYRAAYFERFPGVWCHGDFAELTEHDGMIIYGRSDATLNPGGVRIGTAELYRQVEQLDEVVESLAVGQNWDNDVRVILFVRLRDGLQLDDALKTKIRGHIRRTLTPRHVPAKIIQAPDLPRTRNGKLMELAVRNLVNGKAVVNREASANAEVLDFFTAIPELKI